MYSSHHSEVIGTSLYLYKADRFPPLLVLCYCCAVRQQNLSDGILRYERTERRHLATGVCMIRKFFNWLNQPLGRVAVLIVALTLFSIVAYGIYITQ
mgnify:CR=1 FL=1